MECNQQQTTVAATKTLYENFIEEKCESDLLIPDYFPAAEKIIQCSAVPAIFRKEIEGDRLNLEGCCRFSVIYQGEEDGGIKALSETFNFSESFPIKEMGEEPWVQVILRVSGTSCRLLNPRKVSARATVSAALKVKCRQYTPTIESIDCQEAEALFLPKSVYTVLERVADTAKVQGEIAVHTDVQEVLKTEGVVCIKDVKIMPGKAMVKGVVDLYVLFTPESDPCKVEQTSTAIPFAQVLEINNSEEEALMDPAVMIQNLRTDVESDENGKNRLISITATVMTEGELYANKQHQLLVDAYSNRYPIELKNEAITMEELVEQAEISESVRYDLPLDGEDIEILQVIGSPVVRKITGQDHTLSIEGVMDVSLFMRDGDQYRSADRSFPFTLKKEMRNLSGRMRCEVHPCVIGVDWSYVGDHMELKAEMLCSIMVFSKDMVDVIGSIEVDIEHPIEKEGPAPLVVYYGEKGERLWDIARKYSTSVSSIKQINDMNRDILEDKKLLLISR